MVIEKFRPGMKDVVYKRYAAQGRMLPEGLEYVRSWVEDGGDRCFQLMRTGERELLQQWCSRWEDLVEFELVPVKVSPTIQGAAAPDAENGL
mgnify:CR=1 FL=1